MFRRKKKPAPVGPVGERRRFLGGMAAAAVVPFADLSKLEAPDPSPPVPPLRMTNYELRVPMSRTELNILRRQHCTTGISKMIVSSPLDNES